MGRLQDMCDGCAAGCGECASELPERTNRFKDMMERDYRLVRSIIVLVILMNIPWGRFLLYPFTIFSTWIHEMCHGMAAIFMGGSIRAIYVYKDGSGLASTSLSGGNFYNFKRFVVASAGYTGTAIVGGILLLFRRTRKGPQIGMIGIGAVMLLSCLLWVRNGFALAILIPIGIVFIALGWKLEKGLGTVFAFIAAAICLNAITSIHGLFQFQSCVTGENARTDASTVAKLTGFPYWFWVVQWFVLALVMLFVGLVFVREPSDPDESPGSHYSATVY